ncbi:MAG: ANTAR domain-containing protein [Jatrophihabitans sp.]|uniref:ANTAR domain-containing protein n=1 Tax=Jatrophihabitans sp. TaxID=1932789 RepID=UPI003F7F2D41
MIALDDVTHELAGLAHTWEPGGDVFEALRDLTVRIVRALHLTGAGVSLMSDGALQFVATDSDWSAVLERVQDDVGEGPCYDAWVSGAPSLVTRMGEGEAGRWPTFAATAAEQRAVAVAAVPVRGRKRIGVLDLYVDSEHLWSPDEVAVATAFAAMTATHVLNALALEREQRTVQQLQQALESRVVIEQAKGIVAAERGIGVDEAFRALRKHANDRNVTLRSVAEAVVKLGLRP